jgi:septum formation protein
MLVLASASPRRAELLAAAGIEFTVLAFDIDETPLTDEGPEAHVRRLAEEKARAAAAQRPDAIILGADTVVVVDGRILGKPTDAEDAGAMLGALSGRAHEVITGVALIAPADTAGPAAAAIAIARTQVWFFPLTDAEISWYVASGEPMDKAGAYAIQGLASRFVERIDGSYSNVVGLPVALVYRMLRELPETRRV